MPSTSTTPDSEEDNGLTTRQVATLLNVSTSTVVRYANAGVFGDGVFKLPSGHRRYRRDAVQQVVNGGDAR